MARTTRGRQVPRPFAFHWGGGQIVEEAAYVGEHTEPAIQLLEYEGGGSYGIRSATPTTRAASSAAR